MIAFIERANRPSKSLKFNPMQFSSKEKFPPKDSTLFESVPYPNNIVNNMINGLKKIIRLNVASKVPIKDKHSNQSRIRLTYAQIKKLRCSCIIEESDEHVKEKAKAGVGDLPGHFYMNKDGQRFDMREIATATAPVATTTTTMTTSSTPALSENLRSIYPGVSASERNNNTLEPHLVADIPSQKVLLTIPKGMKEDDLRKYLAERIRLNPRVVNKTNLIVKLYAQGLYDFSFDFTDFADLHSSKEQVNASELAQRLESVEGLLSLSSGQPEPEEMIDVTIIEPLILSKNKPSSPAVVLVLEDDSNDKSNRSNKKNPN